MSLPHKDEHQTLADERLARAYRNATYHVNDLTLKIDEPHPAFDDLLDRHDADYYIILTAYNPFSKPLPRPVNEERHHTLLQFLDQLDWSYLPASGADPSNEWEEEIGVCLLDPPRTQAYEIARIYEQHAIVEGVRRGKPALVWL
ncbi:DUF3293 domain-containing protein [Lewinella sp. IMCC34191]|uniref:DUF3293 domain-containing protein n=1 Tax=Lewinella sp. IMCC34191 TaxID=2259172 RepID=UPI001300175E|nr:DUF3293 domain-containing protein [Lewinella sp. IMCC34191]